MARAVNQVGLSTRLDSTLTLNDGVVMPLFGIGTYAMKEKGDRVAVDALVAAFKHGYRMVDTATFYESEEVTGQAIKESGVKRQDIFVITKVMWVSHGYDNTVKACKESLNSLGIDYIDLYLIHCPLKPDILATYDAMVDLKKEGLVRSVGVSNFSVEFLEQLKKAGRPTPSVNQIELHGACTTISDGIVEYCNKEGIAVMGWSPMAKATKLDDPVVKDLAEKYAKSAAQIMIRWSVQKGYITMPKSTDVKRVVENSLVFDWSLSAEDEAAMDHLPHWSSFEELGINALTRPWEG